REPGGLVLFGLTVSIGAIALGALALWASATEPLDPRVYLATAVAITAVGTLVGIRWGRPGPVITLGAILSTVLVASSLIPSVSMGAINLEPTSVREIRQPVSLGMGEIQIDLRQVSPETSLNGHTLNVTNGIGRIEVIVPEDVDVEVNASVRVGHINALGLERGGNTFQLGNNNNLVHEADGPNPLVINAATNIGEVQVIRK
ncbi:MAG: cell wall-active antibiotics response protein, partial [Actinomycetales bacterium]|nr:cell wall-active antibiotics response protein [Actinomycetales bacterium]